MFIVLPPILAMKRRTRARNNPTAIPLLNSFPAKPSSQALLVLGKDGECSNHEHWPHDPGIGGHLKAPLPSRRRWKAPSITDRAWQSTAKAVKVIPGKSIAIDREKGAWGAHRKHNLPYRTIRGSNTRKGASGRQRRTGRSGCTVHCELSDEGDPV